jgi:hypothetical protein
MFQYHGWARLNNDPHNVNSPNLDRLVEELRQRIHTFGDGSGVTDLRVITGRFHVWVSASPNHHLDQIFGLFQLIAEMAPGSYGLLYVWDDEHEPYNNEFRVWRLLRGRVEEMADSFLSPRIPTIEDPYHPMKEIY